MVKQRVAPPIKLSAEQKAKRKQELAMKRPRTWQARKKNGGKKRRYQDQNESSTWQEDLALSQKEHDRRQNTVKEPKVLNFCSKPEDLLQGAKVKVVLGSFNRRELSSLIHEAAWVIIQVIDEMNAFVEARVNSINEDLREISELLFTEDDHLVEDTIFGMKLPSEQDKYLNKVFELSYSENEKDRNEALLRLNRFLTKFGVVEEIRSEKPKISSEQWDILTPFRQLEKTPEEEMFSSESVETLMDLLEYLPKQAHACHAFADVTGNKTDWLTTILQQNLEDWVSEQVEYCQSYLDLEEQYEAVAEIETID